MGEDETAAWGEEILSLYKMAPQDWSWGPEFHWSEFNDPRTEESDTGLYMNFELLDRLLVLRRNLDVPIVITTKWGLAGGFARDGHAAGSAHYRGQAADIMIPDFSVSLASRAIRDVNFSGVGFYEHWNPHPGFHLDVAPRAPHDRARWLRTKDGLYVSLT